MYSRVLSIFISSLTVGILLFFISSVNSTKVCAYGAGSCSASGSICYTGTDGADVAGGFQCGDAQGYKYADAGGNALVRCHDGATFGWCCDPGVPSPPLPEHVGYETGAQDGDTGCNNLSICYTGTLPANPHPGEQCGDLTGWHYGTTGGSSGSVVNCSFTGLANNFCCDIGAGKPSYLNPCPNDNKNGDCNSIVTALGKIDVKSPVSFIEKLFAILLSISGGIALVIIIISGYRFIISRGDAEKVKNAREAMTSAIVGLIFIIFSLAILQIITIDIFHLPGFTK